MSIYEVTWYDTKISSTSSYVEAENEQDAISIYKTLITDEDGSLIPVERFEKTKILARELYVINRSVVLETEEEINSLLMKKRNLISRLNSYINILTEPPRAKL